MATQEETQPTEEVAASSFDFGKKKKKKTKKKESTTTEDTTVDEQGKAEEKDDNMPTTEEEALALAKKEEEAQAAKEAEEAKRTVDESALSIGKSSDKDYTYEELCNRIFALINAARPEEKTVYKMKPPVVYREGTKKTVWVNFPEICKIMNRAPDHVLAFVLAEVGSTGSIDGSGRLVIRGKFQPKHIETILRHYISEYVKCGTCKSPETHLKKENRLLFMVCEKCGSSRSVQAIKAGFQATTRSSRTAGRE